VLAITEEERDNSSIRGRQMSELASAKNCAGSSRDCPFPVDSIHLIAKVRLLGLALVCMICWPGCSRTTGTSDGGLPTPSDTALSRADGEVCDLEGKCVHSSICGESCWGKTCGVSKCGESCGVCSPGSFCDTHGYCRSCDWGCWERECGPSLCGENCGGCSPKSKCVAGICIPLEG
jgi:hypothetical protein